MAHGTGGSKQGRWALVADADPIAARSLATHLNRLGLWAYASTRGDRGLRLAAAVPLAVAVVDVTLEDMTGHELVARLRAVDDRVSIIMTSADMRAEIVVQARHFGIVYFAPKPVDLERLDAVLARSIRVSP